MTEIAWYPFYVGDYARKTAHLSLLEHGAYRLLLDHYYATRQPLPSDPTKLYRICRARSPSERKAVLSVIAEFFTEDGSLMRSEKCDSEIGKQLKYSDSQSAKAKLRHSNGNAAALPRARVPQSHPQSEEKKVSKKADTPSPYSPEFEEFWKTYPRRDCSKMEAFKSYTQATEGGIDHEGIITGAREFAAYVERKATGQRYIPHASTWLNQRRWEADYRDERPYLDGRPEGDRQPGSEKQRTVAAYAGIIAKRNAATDPGVQGQPEPVDHAPGPNAPGVKGLW